MESDVLRWISEITGETPSSNDVIDALQDGVLLCKLMNCILPNSCKFKKTTQPFVMRENLCNFIAAARKIGVPDNDLFQTVDIIEKRNAKQIENTVYAVSRHAQKANIFKGPFIGPKLAEKQKFEFTDEQKRLAKNAVPLYKEPVKTDHDKAAIIGNQVNREYLLDPKNTGAFEVNKEYFKDAKKK